MDIRSRQIGDVMIMHVKGEIDMNTVSKYKIEFQQILNRGFRKIILDFFELEKLDASGAGATVNFLQFLKKEEGGLAVIDSPKNICRYLRRVPEGETIHVCRSEEDALHYFSLQGTMLPPQEKIRIELKQVDDIVMIIVREQLNIVNVVEFKKTWQEVVLRGAKKVIVNFSELNFIDSSGIGSTVVLRNSIQKVGGSMCVISTRQKITYVIEMTGLRETLHLVSSEAEAINFLRSA